MIFFRLSSFILVFYLFLFVISVSIYFLDNRYDIFIFLLILFELWFLVQALEFKFSYLVVYYCFFILLILFIFIFFMSGIIVELQFYCLLSNSEDFFFIFSIFAFELMLGLYFISSKK